MIDAATENLLQGWARRLGRSLLQYVSESFPFTTDKDQPALSVLARQVQEDQDAVARIGRLLLQHRLRPPTMGAYPMSFTTINFCTLAYLLPYLIDEDERAVTELEHVVKAWEVSEARTLLHGILDQKRRHLQELRGDAAGGP